MFQGVVCTSCDITSAAMVTHKFCAMRCCVNEVQPIMYTTQVFVHVSFVHMCSALQIEFLVNQDFCKVTID